MVRPVAAGNLQRVLPVGQPLREGDGASRWPGLARRARQTHPRTAAPRFHFTANCSGTGLMPPTLSAYGTFQSFGVDDDASRFRNKARVASAFAVRASLRAGERECEQLFVGGVLALDRERPVLEQQRLLRADGCDDRPLHRPFALRLGHRAGETVELRKLRWFPPVNLDALRAARFPVCRSRPPGCPRIRPAVCRRPTRRSLPTSSFFTQPRRARDRASDRNAGRTSQTPPSRILRAR